MLSDSEDEGFLEVLKDGYWHKLIWEEKFVVNLLRVARNLNEYIVEVVTKSERVKYTLSKCNVWRGSRKSNQSNQNHITSNPRWKHFTCWIS